MGVFKVITLLAAAAAAVAVAELKGDILDQRDQVWKVLGETERGSGRDREHWPIVKVVVSCT